MIFRYGNFFIPRVEKSSKISPWEKNLASRESKALGLIFEDFCNPGDEEISIPEKRPIRKSYIFIEPILEAMAETTMVFFFVEF